MCPTCGGSKTVRLSTYPEGPPGVCDDEYHGLGTFWAKPIDAENEKE